MSTFNLLATPAKRSRLTDFYERWNVWWIFGRWCFGREAFTKWTYLVLLAPVMVAAVVIAADLRLYEGNPRLGPILFRTLMWLAAATVFMGGVRHASRAVCWEVSRELRDLVRMTGLEPTTLLWCQTISRWWTVGFSIALMLPLAMYARTMANVSAEQWISGGCWLFSLAMLTAGFATIASVSSNKTSNAETSAAIATLALMVGYHLFFWGGCITIGLISRLITGRFLPPGSSWGSEIFSLLYGLAPVTGLYKGLVSPLGFSVFDPGYWFHLLTAVVCLYLGSIVMRNRLAVTMAGDRDADDSRPTIANDFAPHLRPRCSARPFFWKDTYILGGGMVSHTIWTLVSLFGFFAVLGSAVFENQLVIGVVILALAPSVIAVRFDTLLAAEFRDQTWNSLMVLPIDPRWPLVEKVLAAAWERKILVLPIGAAAVMAAFRDANLVFITATVGLMAGLVMILISIMTQFHAKSWVIGPIVGTASIILIGVLVVVWTVLDRQIAFVTTLMILGFVLAGLYGHIDWRLRHWNDAG